MKNHHYFPFKIQTKNNNLIKYQIWIADPPLTPKSKVLLELLLVVKNNQTRSSKIFLAIKKINANRYLDSKNIITQKTINLMLIVLIKNFFILFFKDVHVAI